VAGITTREVLDRSIGESLDRLITMDMRGDEIGRVVYAAARALRGEPLSMAGGRFLLDKLPREGTTLFFTGFRIPPAGMPETDGLIGSAVLAYALYRARGALPVFVCEPEVVPALAAAVRATGLAVADSVARARALQNTAAIVTFSAGAADPDALAGALADEIVPVLCIAIERPGRNAQGQYHFSGGKNVSDAIARVDTLFVLLGERGVPSLAIGDFGNELGMGAIADVVKVQTPSGGNCGCGCGGGTACEIVADFTFACTVSDWGAYALAAAVSHLVADGAVLVGGDVYRRIIEANVAAGAVDGTSRLAIPHIDGVSDQFNARLLEQMRDVVAHANRPFLDNANRRFRAEAGAL